MAICTACGKALGTEEAHTCNDIQRQLRELDIKAIRPIIDGETDKVNEIKAQKDALRTQL